jgi:hypothetical protein
MRCGGYQRSNSCSRGNSRSRKLKRGRLRRIWVPILTGTEAWLLQQFSAPQSGESAGRLNSSGSEATIAAGSLSSAIANEMKNGRTNARRGILARGSGGMFDIALFSDGSRVFPMTPCEVAGAVAIISLALGGPLVPADRFPHACYKARAMGAPLLPVRNDPSSAERNGAPRARRCRPDGESCPSLPPEFRR